MLGVRKEYWGRDLGYQLKVQQREQALRMGIRMIHWTFDPLQSKNAYLNQLATRARSAGRRRRGSIGRRFSSGRASGAVGSRSVARTGTPR